MPSPGKCGLLFLLLGLGLCQQSEQDLYYINKISKIQVELVNLTRAEIEKLLRDESSADGFMDRCMIITGDSKTAICDSPIEFPADLPLDTLQMRISCGSNRGLDSIPTAVIARYSNLQLLFIDSCPISFITSDTFHNNSNLHTLILKNMPLREIAGDALMSLRKLRALKIINCTQLQNLDLITLTGQSELEQLLFERLNFSQVRTLPELSHLDKLRHITLRDHLQPLKLDRFIWSRLNLISLDLSENQFEDAAFLEFATVQKLNLSGTLIKRGNLQLGQWVTLSTSLKDLDLSGQMFRRVDEIFASPETRIYTPYSQLRQLRMSRNWISDLDQAMAIIQRDIPDLNLLDLSYNRIQHIAPQKVTPSELKVDLQGNPIHCNCVLEYTRYGGWHWLKQRLDDLECATMAVQRDKNYYTIENCAQIICLAPMIPEVQADEKWTQIQKRGNKLRLVWDKEGPASLKIHCTTTGDPPPLVQWIGEGKSLAEGSKTSVFVLQKEQVAQRKKKGLRNQVYRCESNNFVGDIAVEVEIELGLLAAERNLPLNDQAGRTKNSAKSSAQARSISFMAVVFHLLCYNFVHFL
ncbi:hypothetical protein Ciccas_006119 [Cichlidogyrus casuarinus]|uniref:Ig-like domain-containing protein n=1 Tax=Cichlidogyrus casuarinus TaxID=1844966 RepID=A0ABD2Q6P5_9PLAT